MSNIKLNSNKTTKEDGFDVIPNETVANLQKEESPETYVKIEEEQVTKKLFANKKANMALIFVGVVFIIAVLGSLYYIYKPM